MSKKDATPEGRVRQPEGPATRKVDKKLAQGRPTDYVKEVHDAQVYELCLLGATDREIARIFGVSEATLNNWKLKEPSFLESMREGKEPADAKVANALFQRACGYSHPDVDIKVVDKEIVETPMLRQYPPDTQAARFWLMNRQPTRFKERTATEISGLEGGPIAVVQGSLTDYAALRALIKAKALV